jgi:hypothetical protein
MLVVEPKDGIGVQQPSDRGLSERPGTGPGSGTTWILVSILNPVLNRNFNYMWLDMWLEICVFQPSSARSLYHCPTYSLSDTVDSWVDPFMES